MGFAEAQSSKWLYELLFLFGVLDVRVRSLKPKFTGPENEAIPKKLEKATKELGKDKRTARARSAPSRH